MGSHGNAVPTGATSAGLRSLTIIRKACLAAAAVLALFASGASTAAADAACANEDIRSEQGSKFLPDCRAFEKVSPADKGNADATSVAALVSEGAVWGAGDGERVAYGSAGVFAGAQMNGGAVNMYVGSRDPQTGWWTAGIDPGVNSGTSAVGTGGWREFGDEVERAIGLWSNRQPPLSSVPPETGFNTSWYVRSLPLGEWKLIVNTGTEPPLPSHSFAASADLDRVFYNNGPTLYMLDAITGKTVIGSGQTVPQTMDAASADGSKVVVAEGGDLFLRQLEASPPLIPLTEPAPDAPSGESSDSKEYLGSTPDNGVVFFKTRQRLTGGATGGGTANGSGFDLYRYDVANGELLTLTRDTVDPEGSLFQGLTAFSDDGAYAYFVAEGALAPGAVAGEYNLYAWHDDGTRFSDDGQPDGKIDLITVLDEANYEDSKMAKVSIGTKEGDNPGIASPSGGFFAFEAATADDGSGYDSGGLSQVYIYESDADTLRCLTCVATGGIGQRESFLVSKQWLGPQKQIYFKRHRPRNFTQDGSRLYFTSGEALLPGDINGANDVYQYEVETGKLTLISSGRNADPSIFFDTDRSGRDVFFSTRERLVASDTDGLLDLYDARAGGGFPEPPPPPPACEGETCQGPPSPTAEQLAIGSRLVQGPPARSRAAGRRCAPLAAKAKSLRKKSQRLKRLARRADGRKAQKLRVKAKAKAKKSKRLARRARQCHNRTNDR